MHTLELTSGLESVGAVCYASCIFQGAKYEIRTLIGELVPTLVFASPVASVEQ